MKSIVPLLAVLLASASAPAFAGGQRCEGKPVRDAAQFEFLANGSQVLDHKTHLIWMRAIEGQTWDGTTCRADDPQAVNPGPGMTYAQARAYAKAKSAPTEAWRLPTRQELLTLREPGCYNPSFSLELFPTEPAWSSDGDFWTSTPQGSGRALVSAIGTSDSWSAIDPSKRNHVRLVRTVPPPKR